MTDATRADYTQSNDANNNPLVMTLPDFSGYVPKELAEQMLRVTQVPAKTEPKRIRAKEALQKPSLILRPESFYLLHRSNFCANDCSGYF